MNTSTRVRTRVRRDGKSAQPMTFFIKYENNSVEFIGAESRDVKCGEIWMANLPSQDGSIQEVIDQYLLFQMTRTISIAR